MNIKQLEYFVSVAKHLNFTKAAKEHYISQTAISQQIKSLEEILDFKLFNRSKKSVTLTSAGMVLYNDIIKILDNLNSSIQKASLSSSDYVGALTIGFVEGHEKVLLPTILSNFNEKYPNVNINIVRGDIDGLYKKLQDNLLDLVFSFKFTHDKYCDIESKSISTYPLAVAFYPGHHFSNKTTICRCELKNENIIMINPSKTPFFFNSLLSEFEPYGFTPNIIHEADSLETALLLVESKLGITILPNHEYRYKSSNLSFVNLENEITESTISWNKTNLTTLVKLFLDNTIEIIKKQKEPKI